ncbi:MAG: class I SAM-dependent methyltransferase [Sterolibacteriaceae bacterium MAG5]|nr:class I SAM-dependent methyltransferase [Candidatus Nitricoxidireducens bremensis]
MSWDLEASLKRALVRQGWVFGDRYFRIGNPFTWVDGPLQLSSFDFRGVVDLAQWYSGYYEKYLTPESLKNSSYEKDYAILEGKYKEIYNSYFPFFDSSDPQVDLNISCHALARIQDYCMLSKYAPDLVERKDAVPCQKIRHLDFGAGLGGNATYSLFLLDGFYTAIEAHPWSYNIQRMFFRQLVQGKGRYLDLLAAESLELPIDELRKLISSEDFAIKQIPSWYFIDVPTASQDLVTATTVLNELNTAAIIYMLSESCRVLKEGGYLYIRDSAKLKPGRHNVNYDQVLVEQLGFELVHWLDVRNRIDMFAIPRLYRKKRNVTTNFDSLFTLLVGREAVTSHGGEYSQNLKP